MPTYYAARTALPGEELHRLGNVALRPGTRTEIFLKAEDLTLLGYLFKPFSSQMRRIPREHRSVLYSNRIAMRDPARAQIIFELSVTS